MLRQHPSPSLETSIIEPSLATIFVGLLPAKSANPLTTIILVFEQYPKILQNQELVSSGP